MAINKESVRNLVFLYHNHVLVVNELSRKSFMFPEKFLMEKKHLYTFNLGIHWSLPVKFVSEILDLPYSCESPNKGKAEA